MRMHENSLIFVQIILLVVRGVLGQLLTNILPPNPTYLQIYALPVGQGDCTIIQCPGSGKIIVLDCGSNGGNSGNRFRAANVQSFLGDQINQVQYIMTSHGDRDHVSYLSQISWNPTSVVAVILGGQLSDYGTWVNAWNNMNKLYTINSQTPCIAAGGANCTATNAKTGAPITTMATLDLCSNSAIVFQILAANVGRSKNEMSTVMKVNQGGWSILFSGDMEGDASKTVAKALGSTLKSIVYKISHHGAGNMANLDEWLQPIKPQYAFASNGYQFSNCRHPRCQAITRLLSYGTIVTSPHTSFTVAMTLEIQ